MQNASVEINKKCKCRNDKKNAVEINKTKNAKCKCRNDKKMQNASVEINKK